MVAIVDTAVFVTAGTPIKLEQKGVAFCSFKMSTMKLTSLQRFGGAAKATCTRSADRTTNLEGIMVERLREPRPGRPGSSRSEHRQGICIFEPVVHGKLGGLAGASEQNLSLLHEQLRDYYPVSLLIPCVCASIVLSNSWRSLSMQALTWRSVSKQLK
jgi:hypothetical protein